MTYAEGINEVVRTLDGANSSNNGAEEAASRLRADYLKCVEHGMGTNEEGRARWNSIVKDVTSQEVKGKGWDARSSDADGDGVLELTLNDPKTGFSIFGSTYMQQEKTINLADSSKKNVTQGAYGDADNSTVYKEVRF